MVVPPAACAALIPARATLPNTDAALVLVAFTVAVAALGNRLAGYLAATGTAFWFDFFLTVPYQRLAITHRTDLQTTVLLLVLGAAVTELAVAARRRARVVAIDEALLAVVQSTAALVARGEPVGTVIDQVCVQLRAVLAAQGCTFEPGPGASAACTSNPTARCAGGPRCGTWPSTASQTRSSTCPPATTARSTAASPWTRPPVPRQVCTRGASPSSSRTSPPQPSPPSTSTATRDRTRIARQAQ